MQPDTVASSLDAAPPATSPTEIMPPSMMPPPAEALPVEDVNRNDTLAQEVAPAEKPDGAPDLWPFIKLPRRKRATFMRKIGPIMQGTQALDERQKLAEIKRDAAKAAGLPEPEADGDFTDAAEMFDLTADIEDALRIAVVPGDDAAFDAYMAGAGSDDEVLMAYFQWYMETFQPGEAPPSPS